MVVRSNDGAFTRRIDFGDVLGPSCLRCEGVASHGEMGVNGEMAGVYIDSRKDHVILNIVQ